MNVGRASTSNLHQRTSCKLKKSTSKWRHIFLGDEHRFDRDAWAFPDGRLCGCAWRALRNNSRICHLKGVRLRSRGNRNRDVAALRMACCAFDEVDMSALKAVERHDGVEPRSPDGKQAEVHRMCKRQSGGCEA